MGIWTSDSKNGIILLPSRKTNDVKHRKIRKFGLSGVFVSDAKIPSLRPEVERMLTQDARDRGYVPVLDLDTLWSTQYDLERNEYIYSSVLYCIYVGKRKAKEWQGWQSGKGLVGPLIQKHTSERSSETSA